MEPRLATTPERFALMCGRTARMMFNCPKTLVWNRSKVSCRLDVKRCYSLVGLPLLVARRLSSWCCLPALLNGSRQNVTSVVDQDINLADFLQDTAYYRLQLLVIS